MSFHLPTILLLHTYIIVSSLEKGWAGKKEDHAYSYDLIFYTFTSATVSPFLSYLSYTLCTSTYNSA